MSAGFSIYSISFIYSVDVTILSLSHPNIKARIVKIIKAKITFFIYKFPSESNILIKIDILKTNSANGSPTTGLTTGK